jgi:hypothetical protein
VTLRRDHVAGGAFVLIGALVLAMSGDLPFGTLASPGAGMLPKLTLGLMMAFGAVLVARGRESPPFTELKFADLPHALRVVAVVAAAVALYTAIGFAATMPLMLFALTFVIERRPILYAVLFSAGVTGLAWLLFDKLLKSPLPGGSLWL